MAREPLRTASDRCRQASEAAGDADTEERLYALSNDLAGLAVADDGPDHGRLAKLMHDLDTLADDLDGDAQTAVEDAYAEVKAYRSTVEGV
jgi:hypothetical protein